MSDAREGRVDRYLAGKLSRREERELAHAALDDPDLFDELTAIALAEGAVGRNAAASSTPEATRDVVPRFRKRHVAVLGGLAALAASILAFVVVQRGSNPDEPLMSVVSEVPPRAPAGAPRAAVLAAAPVLLTARLDEAGRHASTEFRGGQGDVRPAKVEGVIVSVDGDIAALDVGALDGVAQGSILPLIRGSERTPVGRLTVTRVFRERSTGTVKPLASARAGDRVELPADVQVAAHLEQIAARLAAGDLERARAHAERAVTLAQSRDVPADRRRRVETALAEVLNEVGAARIRDANYSEAEEVLQRAEKVATGSIAIHIANNRAATAALRGDFAAADALYRAALRMAGTSSGWGKERSVIEWNLEGLRAPR